MPRIAQSAAGHNLFALIVATSAASLCSPTVAAESQPTSSIGRHQIRTLPLEGDVNPLTATYTPSGRVLVSYEKPEVKDPRQVNIAIMDDDGRNMRTIFSQLLPVREKDNGIRYMVFNDNKRVFMGDFILECAPSLNACDKSTLLPLEYPAEVASGDHVSHRWSEMIVAPDNRHVGWTTLLANYSAVVLTGELRRRAAGYVVVKPRIVSTLEPFTSDPGHPDGVMPQPLRNGEVKQFVGGGTAISMAGAVKRDIPDSVVQDLATGKVEAITDTPGYDETTIFSPDEHLGLVMTTRFSEPTDLAILGLIPRPYPPTLNMGLSMFVYTYAVMGVRAGRPGNVGPALIEIQRSKTEDGYLGLNLSTQPEWIFRSPMSWHPSSKKAMWMEGKSGGGLRRIQIVELPDYKPGKTVASKPTPDNISYASSDLSIIPGLVKKTADINVKVYGKASGHIEYRRSATNIEKVYVNFSDDGRDVYAGRETMQVNPRGNSTYTADVRVTGANPGVMDLKITFGPLGGAHPAGLLFTPDTSGAPLTHGYAEYKGKRLTVESLAP
jgi:hypothetical protein